MNAMSLVFLLVFLGPGRYGVFKFQVLFCFHLFLFYSCSIFLRWCGVFLVCLFIRPLRARVSAGFPVARHVSSIASPQLTRKRHEEIRFSIFEQASGSSPR